jgi:hypothetical protein
MVSSRRGTGTVWEWVTTPDLPPTWLMLIVEAMIKISALCDSVGISAVFCAVIRSLKSNGVVVSGMHDWCDCPTRGD